MFQIMYFKRIYPKCFNLLEQQELTRAKKKPPNGGICGASSGTRRKPKGFRNSE